MIVKITYPETTKTVREMTGKEPWQVILIDGVDEAIYEKVASTNEWELSNLITKFVPIGNVQRRYGPRILLEDDLCQIETILMQIRRGSSYEYIAASCSSVFLMNSDGKTIDKDGCASSLRFPEEEEE